MLNTRGIFDPRWALHHRPPAVSGMLAQVVVLHPKGSVKEWDPFADDPEDRKWAGGVHKDYTVHYRGAGRVQPNKDWRARRYQWGPEAVADHAVRIQIDLQGNKVVNPAKLRRRQKDFEAGGMHHGDIIEVTRVAAPFGVVLDPLVAQYQYVIRNISVSSNPWVRTLLCDFVVNEQKNG